MTRVTDRDAAERYCMIKGGRVERSVKMRKQNALIAGTVVIASVLALAQSANAQGYYQPVPGGYYYQPVPGGYYYPPGPGYPRPAPAFLPRYMGRRLFCRRYMGRRRHITHNRYRSSLRTKDGGKWSGPAMVGPNFPLGQKISKT